MTACKQQNSEKVQTLIRRGVRIPCPQSVEIEASVDVERISANGVTIFGGCRIRGAHTFIGEQVRIGTEGPVTLENCQVGPGSDIKAGYLQKTVLLGNNQIGSGAHVRQGTILEEEASIAHTVGLKQTILFPFVTLGSLINFCDVFMAGGTSRQHHSEVGSSFVHFNYTPNQDKATPSLIGDVPHGVLLKQHPIFLGGQGGLVGPTLLAFGTVTAAGTICRKDQLKPDRLVIGGGGRGGVVPYNPSAAINVKRILKNNMVYIANLMALRDWYHDVRPLFISSRYPAEIHFALQQNLASAIDERIQRLGRFLDNLDGKPLENAIAATNFSRAGDLLPAMRAYCPDGVGSSQRDLFLSALENNPERNGRDYIDTIQRLDTDTGANASTWLQAIVDDFTNRMMSAPQSQGPQ